jgi:succinyl-diaminopimelate desuccinylase
VVSVFDRLSGPASGPIAPGAAPYFTDAAFLTPALGGPPTLILGPGDGAMAHKTDESCSIAAMEAAAGIYFDLGRSWCGL